MTAADLNPARTRRVDQALAVAVAAARGTTPTRAQIANLPAPGPAARNRDNAGRRAARVADLDTRVRALYNRGHDDYLIAFQLDVSASVVLKSRQRQKLPARRGGWTEGLPTDLVARTEAEK